MTTVADSQSPSLTTGDSQEPSVQFPDNSDFDQDELSDIDDGIPFGECVD